MKEEIKNYMKTAYQRDNISGYFIIDMGNELYFKTKKELENYITLIFWGN